MKRSVEERQAVEQKIMSAILSLRPEERSFTRISRCTGLDMRTIDAALQALRRAGKIKYNHSKRIWELTTKL